MYWTGGPKLSHSPGFAGLAEVKRRVRQRLHKKLGSLLTCEEFGRAMESWQMGLGIQLGEVYQLAVQLAILFVAHWHQEPRWASICHKMKR